MYLSGCFEDILTCSLGLDTSYFSNEFNIISEGKSQLTIAVGCTGGKHRSITFARKIAEYCTQLGYEPGVQHRDAKR